MFKGMQLNSLAQELKRQLTSKKDLKAPTTCLEAKIVHPDDEDPADGHKGRLVLSVAEHGDFHMTSHFHDQLGTWCGIPSKYYDRMLQNTPSLLADNLNHWLHHQLDDKTGGPQTKLVRLLDAQARAFLSNRYRTIDNFDVADIAVPIMVDHGCEVLSSNVDYNKMYVKAATPRLTREVKRGDVVQFGVCLSNSEVGQGSVKVEPFIYRLVCTNGMVVPDAALKRFHVGRMADELEAAAEVFKDETRAADDRAFMLKLRDVLEASFKQEAFDGLVSRMIESADQPIVKPVAKVVEVVTQRWRLTEGQGESVLQHLAGGGDLTRWGLINALTRTAEDQTAYDQAHAFERLGGELLMDDQAWREVAA